MDAWVNLAAAGLAVLTGLLGLTQYLNFKSKRQRQAEVGEAFARVVSGLAAGAEVERLSSAALLRRFFDAKSEFGQAGLPYAGDATKVIAAVLRTEATGNVQKILADSLASAPSLRSADLQRANLQGCYWGKGSNGQPLDLSEADLYGADLTGASLRGALMFKTTFREANLARCVLDGADCREANFDLANLREVRLNGTRLRGATFRGAMNLPPGLVSQLDADGVFVGEEFDRVPAPSPVGAGARRAFVSAPSVLAEMDQIALEQIMHGVTKAGWDPVRYLPFQYNHANPPAGVLGQIRDCDAVIVFGPPQVRIHVGSFAQSVGVPEEVRDQVAPSPWNQLEAGMAVGMDKPLLVVRRIAEGGVLDLESNFPTLRLIDLGLTGQLSKLSESVIRWCGEIDHSTNHTI